MSRKTNIITKSVQPQSNDEADNCDYYDVGVVMLILMWVSGIRTTRNTIKMIMIAKMVIMSMLQL